MKSVPVTTVQRPTNQGPVEPLEMRVPDQTLVRRASVSLSMGLDAMARQIGSRGSNESASIRAVRHTFVAITVGYVVWSLRGASLIASLLTSMPLWRSLDPLPILENRVQPLTRKRRRWFRRRGGGGSGGGGGSARAEQPLGEMVN